MKRLLTLLILFAGTASAQIAVRGETVHTMAGASIRDGVVLIRDGKIERVGPAANTQIPAGYKTIQAKVVTPGLVDAHTVVGLAGYLNQPHDQMQVERSAPIQPELRAFDAYDGRELLVAYLRSFGVTTLHTGHGTGTLVSGQTMIVKSVGDEVDAPGSTLKSVAMIAVTVGADGLAQGKSPGTRAKQFAMLRTELIKAKEYQAKVAAAKEDAKPARDLRTEIWVRVLAGELPLLVNVQRAHDIISVLRLADEFKIKVVLDGAAEAYQVIDQVKAAHVPVIIHPTMARNNGEMENASMDSIAVLRKAGIPVALQSGFEGYVPKTRVVLFEAALAASRGLSFDQALASITIDAARIIGVADRVGSLEAGKDADVVLYDGDPFEYASHVTTVICNGKVVSEIVR